MAAAVIFDVTSNRFCRLQTALMCFPIKGLYRFLGQTLDRAASDLGRIGRSSSFVKTKITPGARYALELQRFEFEQIDRRLSLCPLVECANQLGNRSLRVRAIDDGVFIKQGHDVPVSRFGILTRTTCALRPIIDF
ncbi:hypothetical protein [Tateyamaria omphalii]|uniref:hypothetical protein n=1 Tax=Tateyamaria omphalii TaxID=299262 RepID=UPI001E441545|nr:hypothetical protein [Tateyamaria omphalii]